MCMCVFVYLYSTCRLRITVQVCIYMHIFLMSVCLSAPRWCRLSVTASGCRYANDPCLHHTSHHRFLTLSPWDTWAHIHHLHPPIYLHTHTHTPEHLQCMQVLIYKHLPYITIHTHIHMCSHTSSVVHRHTAGRTHLNTNSNICIGN